MIEQYCCIALASIRKFLQVTVISAQSPVVMQMIVPYLPFVMPLLQPCS